jgi:hypothetical protein
MLCRRTNAVNGRLVQIGYNFVETTHPASSSQRSDRDRGRR